MTCRPFLLRLFILSLIVDASNADDSDFMQHRAIDKNSVSAILFSLDTDSFRPFGQNLALRPLTEQISRNLEQWRFPVKSAATAAVSHYLQAQLGAISQGDTPVGFSFSNGNSDPRAINFQKTQILPINCRLTAASSSAVIAEYRTTVSARGLLPAAAGSSADRLADDISTACFNLLDKLGLQTEPANQPGKPGWMPNVRVEIKTPPAPQQPVSQQPAPQLTDAATASEAEKTTVQRRIQGQRKQIIIQNQGSPLILEFGHQRR